MDLIERLREVADEAGAHGYGVSGLLREAAAPDAARREGGSGKSYAGLNATVLAAHAPVPAAVNGGGSSVAVFD